MVKGCRRSMIVLRDTDSALYEEAYFLLREEIPTPLPPQSQLIEEANRIVAGNLVAAVGQKKRRACSVSEGALWFLSGLLVGLGIAFLLML